MCGILVLIVGNTKEPVALPDPPCAGDAGTPLAPGVSTPRSCRKRDPLSPEGTEHSLIYYIIRV